MSCVRIMWTAREPEYPISKTVFPVSPCWMFKFHCCVYGVSWLVSMEPNVIGRSKLREVPPPGLLSRVLSMFTNSENGGLPDIRMNAPRISRE